MKSRAEERSEGNIRLYTDADIRRIQLLIEAKKVLGFLARRA